jgi:hypothetical protein
LLTMKALCAMELSVCMVSSERVTSQKHYKLETGNVR